MELQRGRDVYKVARFVEKPDLKTAEAYLEAGGYYWNAGMFVWSVSAITAELEANTPSLWSALQEIDKGLSQGEDLDALLAVHYPNLEKISVDYAIIEKADNVVMVESGFDWDDVGEWPAVERHYPADDVGNVVRGEAHLEAAFPNIVFSRDPDHLVALLGVEDLIVVRTEDATLICSKIRLSRSRGWSKISDRRILEPIDVGSLFTRADALQAVIDECAIWELIGARSGLA